MVRHVVMWNFKPEIKEEDKAELKRNMKENLSKLQGKVEGLLSVSFIENPEAGSTHEIALVTEHESAEAVLYYGTHPEHVKVADTYVRQYTCERACLNYKIL